MKRSVTAAIARSVLCGALALGAAPAAAGPGPKVVEIDAEGTVRTTSGTDAGKKAPTPRPVPAPAAGQKPRDKNASMPVCEPGYRWLPVGVSADTVARTKAFYRDVTGPYERAHEAARAKRGRLSRAQEIEYWNAYKRFLDSVPREERAVADRGVSPRMRWWCNAPPVIPPAIPLPRPAGGKRP